MGGLDQHLEILSNRRWAICPGVSSPETTAEVIDTELAERG